MTVVGVIEARMGSSRLPGKMLMPLAGRPVLEHVVRRAQDCRSLDRVIVVTTVEPGDDVLAERTEALGAACHRGSTEDVLGRVLAAARAAGGDVIVKLSGDNPLYHREYVDPIVTHYLDGGYDFVSNTAMGFSPAWDEERTWPVGAGGNVFATQLLDDCRAQPIDDADREHVIRYFVMHPELYRLGGFHADGAHAILHRPERRFALDTDKDLAFLDAHPELRAINAQKVLRAI